MILRIEIVTDSRRFAEIREDWQQLRERSNGYVFQDHDWISGWLSGVRNRKEIKLHIALAWEGSQLRGVFPCAVHRRSGLRVLTWAAQLFSDYCDCVLDPILDRANLLAALWKGMAQSGGFDVINLQQVRPDAQCRAFLDRLAEVGTDMHPGDRKERCMRIENHWPDGEAFVRSRSKSRRSNYTRGKRILAELGGDVRFRLVEEGESTAPIVDEIIRLKQIWLQACDPESTQLGSDGAVLRAMLDKVVESRLARIFLLETGGRIAAASINFVYAQRMEAYFTAYDATFERASPGTILIVDYARWSFDRGLSHVDFLRGDEAFKGRLANAETILSSFAGARTLLGQVAVSGHRWLSRRRQRQETSPTNDEKELEHVA